MNRIGRRTVQVTMCLISSAALARGARGQEMIWKAFGDHANQNLGWNVTGVGDLTGDGIPDVLVGQPFDLMNTNGMVRVLSGADGSTVYSILGANTGDQLGVCADLGDVDGDGVSDFVVCAPQGDNTFTDQ